MYFMCGHVLDTTAFISAVITASSRYGFSRNNSIIITKFLFEREITIFSIYCHVFRMFFWQYILPEVHRHNKFLIQAANGLLQWWNT